MGSEVFVGREWISVVESDTEIMDALEAIEKRGSTTRLREQRHMKIAPGVIHGIRELRGQT